MATTEKSRFKTANEMASLIGTTKERILELVNAGYMPYVTVDGDGPFFQISQTREWWRANMVRVERGIPFPRVATIICDGIPKSPIPDEIRNVEGVRQIQYVAPFSGIYFLCRGGKVVYVGQSVNVPGRVPQHGMDSRYGSAKDFDEVFVLPCPEDQLLAIESAYIKALMPEYNYGSLREKIMKNRAKKEAV